ncbi:hypothetical protein B0H12DRAFT_1077963 [Mycena haematopus]|nr:hypothetical protein B0H12DRAFT_1077963 [Mycena haematopus]
MLSSEDIGVKGWVENQWTQVTNTDFNFGSTGRQMCTHCSQLEDVPDWRVCVRRPGAGLRTGSLCPQNSGLYCSFRAMWLGETLVEVDFVVHSKVSCTRLRNERDRVQCDFELNVELAKDLRTEQCRVPCLYDVEGDTLIHCLFWNISATIRCRCNGNATWTNREQIWVDIGQEVGRRRFRDIDLL